MSVLRFLPAGDRALAVEVGDEISTAVSTRVRALEYLIGQKGVPGVVETVPSFRGVLVYYDPLVTTYPALCEALTALEAQMESTTLPPPRRLELPCCYDDPQLGFELAGAAARLGLAPDDLVRQHAAAEYLVYFIGFTPGLPYMDLPERLTIARLETPRTKTPPGSVSIGGAQCCIYPTESPGGFWVLGRTPLRLYDPAAAAERVQTHADHFVSLLQATLAEVGFVHCSRGDQWPKVRDALYADVTEPLVVEVDEIYHLACPASPVHYQRNPVRTIRTAVQGTLNMLDMAREVHARILIASTSEVYGKNIKDTWTEEDDLHLGPTSRPRWPPRINIE